MPETYWSFEAPLNHLQDFSDLQDYHLALSFLLSDKRYVTFLEEERINKNIILDNSYNELKKAEGIETLIQMAEMIKADAVISPDDHTWTTEETINAYKVLKSKSEGKFQIMVPTKSMDEARAAWAEGVIGLALPYRFRPFMPEAFPWHKTHFLGLRDPIEVKMLKPISCDTSMPIKIALQGMTIDEWIIDICPHVATVPDFFHINMTIDQVELARRNIKRLKEVCNE